MSTIQPNRLGPTAAPRRLASDSSAPGGPQDSVEIGSMPLHNCWDPRQWSKAPEVRPELAPVLDGLAHSDVSGIGHTTRSIPRLAMHTPAEPRPFAAGRFEVKFNDNESGHETAFIFQTEAGPGHLAQVVPGRTEIPGGSVSLLADPAQPFGKETPLNTAEVDRLLDGVYKRFNSPMTDKQAGDLQSVISFGSAIRYSGQGAEAVKIAHSRRFVETVAIK
jgi:hypothetical protein